MSSLQHATYDELPESLRELGAVIGLPGVIALVERWGGLSALYVPQNIPDSHPIAYQLGREAANALASMYGGSHLRNIPRAVGAVRAARDRALVRRREEGASAADLALEFGLTERWVWAILGNAQEHSKRKQPKQASLFS